ncbi:hypothetical protein [Egbenema bharatensis]|uniref:hypothetical protein n=1 Tax=Egbenema bharatensis TaxID=3463334 RepID=UPI003A8B8467
MASKENADFAKNSKNQPSEQAEQSPGQRLAEINENPKISLEEARNANEGKGPNASGSAGSSDAEEHIPSSSDPEATDLPTAR